MNKPVTIAILRSGLVPSSITEEMRRWGLPVNLIDVDQVQTLSTADEVVQCVREAVEGDDNVKLRATDLDALAHYLREHRTGQLVIAGEAEGASSKISITYTKLPNGRYIIPWKSDDSIAELLTDSESYLRIKGGERVHFEDVEELFFGGVKAFISARPKQAV